MGASGLWLCLGLANCRPVRSSAEASDTRRPLCWAPLGESRSPPKATALGGRAVLQLLPQWQLSPSPGNPSPSLSQACFTTLVMSPHPCSYLCHSCLLSAPQLSQLGAPSTSFRGPDPSGHMYAKSRSDSTTHTHTTWKLICLTWFTAWYGG